jgi:hypothetical protein
VLFQALKCATQQKLNRITNAGYTKSKLFSKGLQDNNRNGIKYIDEKQASCFNSALGKRYNFIMSAA